MGPHNGILQRAGKKQATEKEERCLQKQSMDLRNLITSEKSGLGASPLC